MLRDLKSSVVAVIVITVVFGLGLPAVFLFGGLERSEKTIRMSVAHGDILVWGGPARLCYHGVNPLKDGAHLLAGRYRWKLEI